MVNPMPTNDAVVDRLSWLPRVAAVAGGLSFLVLGLWAMVDPESFFEQVADFEPYNQHFLQDIGAFQIGLGAILLLAALLGGADALLAGLLGAAIGSAAHLVSHAVGHDLGGTPETDIPFFAIVTVVLLAGAMVRWRQLR
jgi:hypothetical protein